MFEQRDRHARSPAHKTALACLEAGLDAVQPDQAVERSLSLTGDTLQIADDNYNLERFDRLLVLGAGKASGGVTRALESLLGDRLDGGVVIVDAPPEPPLDRVAAIVGDHPIPGAGSLAGTDRLLELANTADTDTLILAVFTGGGSALLTAPAPGLSLSAVQDATESLLAAGADIEAVNMVRRHCSAIKDGRLANACAPATVVSLLVSDVVGDDPAVIASGPTVPDSTTPMDALAVLDRYRLDAPALVAHLRRNRNEVTGEPKTAATQPFSQTETHVILSGRTALEAASAAAETRGYTPWLLSAGICGEARQAGRFHAAIARETLVSATPVVPPAVLLSGGECTVTVDGDGTGGPNGEFALGAVLKIPLDTSIVVGAIDTDGRDGSTEAAGALVDTEVVSTTHQAQTALDANNSFPYLQQCEALLHTGRTGTNVNDLRVVVIDEPPSDDSVV
jgi:hydroxypyruvate reductase